VLVFDLLRAAPMGQLQGPPHPAALYPPSQVQKGLNPHDKKKSQRTAHHITTDSSCWSDRFPIPVRIMCGPLPLHAHPTPYLRLAARAGCHVTSGGRPTAIRI
jgi:hypothetical protein